MRSASIIGFALLAVPLASLIGQTPDRPEGAKKPAKVVGAAGATGAKAAKEPSLKPDLKPATVAMEFSKATPEQIDALQGKWRVVKVQRDGKPQHGEVGQAVDDIITIEMDLNGGLLFG